MAEMKQISRRLSIGDMGIDGKAIVADMTKDGDTVVVARIYGRASGYDARPSKLDPTRSDIRFKGEFEGVNMLTGEVFAASGCYLPGAAEDNLRSTVDALQDGEAALFGVEIALKKSAKSPVGYVYGVAVPKQPEAADPLSAIRAEMGGLPAPTKAKQIEAPSKK